MCVEQDYGFVEFSLPATAERAKAALDKMRHGAPTKRMTVAEKKEEERRQEEAGVDGAVAGPSASLEQAVAGAAGSSASAKVPVPHEHVIPKRSGGPACLRCWRCFSCICTATDAQQSYGREVCSILPSVLSVGSVCNKGSISYVLVRDDSPHNAAGPRPGSCDRGSDKADACGVGRASLAAVTVRPHDLHSQPQNGAQSSLFLHHHLLQENNLRCHCQSDCGRPTWQPMDARSSWVVLASMLVRYPPQ